MDFPPGVRRLFGAPFGRILSGRAAGVASARTRLSSPARGEVDRACGSISVHEKRLDCQEPGFGCGLLAGAAAVFGFFGAAGFGAAGLPAPGFAAGAAGFPPPRVFAGRLFFGSTPPASFAPPAAATTPA